MLNAHHLLNSAMPGCCVCSSLIDQQLCASPWPCWLCCIAFPLTELPSHLSLYHSYAGAARFHRWVPPAAEAHIWGSMASALHRGWNLSFCPNFGPPFWPQTTLVSFVPFLFFHELFPPSFHIRTHLCMLCPSLPAPFYALSPIFCLLLLKVAYCLLPFHLESCSLLLSPSFLSFYLVYSLFLRSLYAYLGVWHISNCCCLFMFSVLSFLLTSQNSFLIACTHQHPLFYHILCAFARLILMSISSTTFLFTYDPLYRMH